MSSTLYSKQTIDTVNLLDPRQIPYDLVVRILERLCFESAEHADYSHAVLIFLPGLQEIRKMHDALVDHDVFGNPNAFRLFPLHSTISSEGQSAVFDIPPQGVRKIVMGESRGTFCSNAANSVSRVQQPTSPVRKRFLGDYTAAEQRMFLQRPVSPFRILLQ
jgi:hypothetical protein